MTNVRMTVALISCAATQPAFGQSQWSGNGHWYEFVSAPGITWTAADAAAQTSVFMGANGHLVTLTSPPENDWVAVNIAPASGDSLWLGGIQDPSGQEPGGAWTWVTGEAWAFTNWNAGEPNNSGNEDWLTMNLSPPIHGTWNDGVDTGLPLGLGYIVEYVPEPASLAFVTLGALAVARRRPIQRIDAPGISTAGTGTSVQVNRGFRTGCPGRRGSSLRLCRFARRPTCGRPGGRTVAIAARRSRDR